MSFQDLMNKAKTNWKYIALIVSVVILLVILYYYYKKGRNYEGMSNSDDDSDQELMMGASGTSGSEAAAGAKGSQQTKTDGEIVLYYATWCGYSRMFLPEWEKFEGYAKTNIPNLKVSSIRCEGGNENVCTQKGVDGYPTTILYLNNGQEVQFNGERTSQQLVDFVKKYL